MNKYIVTAALGGDEPVAFGGVKPFHGASWHNLRASFVFASLRRAEWRKRLNCD
eukprot:CAMPEP_0184463338 /NCGR_PEP_ID=MMETSP0740-20130409/51934_1 /TAXON_ID=385413 /ORGANISM="Thalassiosira miniscula, Strain CCMP1093" /LENGTH=53 /DNA_ID=CAMNT_0026837531 /DNA_START=28 /DNA_END=186 /DNA_ORIENTATION=-